MEFSFIIISFFTNYFSFWFLVFETDIFSFSLISLDNYSYMTSIIHLLYNISSLYKYYHNKVNSKNDKFSIHLHNTLVYYNNSKKNNIPPDKRIIDITKLSNM